MSKETTSIIYGKETTLYYEGKLPDKEKPTVAICGARFCSAYGRYMANMYGNTLAAAGYQIVNGMALGIEGTALRGALQAEGTVYAILGNGVDVCYPPENRVIYDEIKKSGGVISTYEDGTAPKPGSLSKRHELVAHFADAVIVIEARKQAGALVPAEIARKIGKPVYAVPGRVTDRLSDGTNLMIQKGEAIATISPEDFIKSMGERS